MGSKTRRQVYLCAVQFDAELRAGKLAILDVAPVAVRYGLQGVEYRDVYWQDKARELPAVRDQLVQLGLTPVYATFTPLFSRDPAKQAQLRQDVADAHALGARLLRVFRGERPTGVEDAALRDAAQAVVDLAAGYGIQLALENHIGHLGNQLADVLETLEWFAPSVMGTNVDIANYACNGQDPVEAIKVLAPRIVYCHLKDAKETPAGLKQTYLGNGSLPLRAIMAALDATGRSFPFTFEFGGEGDPEGALAKSIAHLAEIEAAK